MGNRVAGEVALSPSPVFAVGDGADEAALLRAVTISLSGRARITEMVEQAFGPVSAQPGKAVPPVILARRLGSWAAAGAAVGGGVPRMPSVGLGGLSGPLV